jgi:tetratricopeptide (TPR) repeat protein
MPGCRVRVMDCRDNDDSHSAGIVAAESLLASRERDLGLGHPDTIAAREQLASAYTDVGRLDDGIEIHKRALAECERVLGTDDPMTLRVRHSVAEALWTDGWPEESIAVYKRSLADRERVLGTDHPDTLLTAHALATAYWLAGRPADSISMFERALAGRAQVAIAIREQMLADQARLLGAGHLATLRTALGLGDLRLGTNQASSAIIIYERTLMESEQALGAESLYPGDKERARHGSPTRSARWRLSQGHPG